MGQPRRSLPHFVRADRVLIAAHDAAQVAVGVGQRQLVIVPRHAEVDPALGIGRLTGLFVAHAGVARHRIIGQLVQEARRHVERQRAVGRQAQGLQVRAIGRRHVPTRVGVLGDVHHLVDHPADVAVGAAHDVAAERIVQGRAVDAVVDDRARAERGDDVADLDVVVVDGDRQPRQEGRRQDDAQGQGFALFRVQVRVALADGRLGRDRLGEVGRQAQGRAVGLAVGGIVAQVQPRRVAGVVEQGEAFAAAVEQFADVRRAHGLGVVGAETDVAVDRPLHAQAIAAVAARGGVVLEAIGRCQVQVLDEGHVGQQGQIHLAEDFLGLIGALGSGLGVLEDQRLLRTHVRHGAAGFLAPFHARREGDRQAGSTEQRRIREQLAVDAGHRVPLTDAIIANGVDVGIVDRLLRADIGAEQIQRLATPRPRIRAAADDLVRRRIAPGVDRLIELLLQAVEVGELRFRLAVVDVGLKPPAVAEGAVHPGHEARGVIDALGGADAEVGVDPADVEERHIGLRQHGLQFIRQEGVIRLDAIGVARRHARRAVGEGAVTRLAAGLHMEILGFGEQVQFADEVARGLELVAQLQLAAETLDRGAQHVVAQLEAVAADRQLLLAPGAVVQDLAAVERDQLAVRREGQGEGLVGADRRDDDRGEEVVLGVGVDVPRHDEGRQAVVGALLVRVRNLGQGAHGVVALVAEQPLGLVIGQRAHDVGPVVIEVPPHGDRAVVGVRTVGRAVLRLDGNAVEVLLGDEVDHPGHGVRAVDRRRTACHRVDACDRRLGDGVHVHRAGARRAGDMAAAVDQHQGAAGAQITQVQRRQPLP